MLTQPTKLYTTDVGLLLQIQQGVPQNKCQREPKKISANISIETNSTFIDLAKEHDHGLIVHTYTLSKINFKEQIPV